MSAPPLAVICWPFDRGLPDVGMGAGASLLAGDQDLHTMFEALGWAPTLERIPAAGPGAAAAGEVARIFELLRAQAGAVAAAVGRGAFPLVFSGGCISAAANAAGSGARGVVWMDAHADLDTPADNLSGSMDVMALSILGGTAWQASAAKIPGFAAIAPRDTALLGARDLAPHQRDAMHASGVRLAPGDFSAADARAAISGLPAAVYLHIDLDVLDISVGRANRHAAPGGPSLSTVLQAIDITFEHATVVAAALTAYEPPADRGGGIAEAARTIATHIATRALGQFSRA